MTRFTRERSTPFAVAFLLSQEGKKEEYVDYFQKNDKPFLDCVEPWTEENQIPGEGHPNEKLNSFWAQRIPEKLPELLGRAPAPNREGEDRRGSGKAPLAQDHSRALRRSGSTL